VSCRSALFCAAVDKKGAAVTYNGHSWGDPTIIDSTGGGLTSVSCPSASFCAAVDDCPSLICTSDYGNAVIYNNGSWGDPTIIDSNGGGLTSVSCPSASFCAAVDHDGHAVIYNNRSWGDPTIIDSSGGGFSSVSCPSPSFCAAVDEKGNAVAYNNGLWGDPTTIDSKAGGLELESGLSSVSCPSPLFCVAADLGGYAVVYSVGPSAAQVKAALSNVLVPHGKGAKIEALLGHGGYSVSFTAPSAGQLVVSWYLVPRGAHLTRARSTRRPVLVATVSAQFSEARSASLKIILTRKGRQLLRGAKSVPLTADGKFTPSGEQAITVTKRFALKR
jgi:hypothetical protein